MPGKSWLVGPNRLAKSVPQSKLPQRIFSGKGKLFQGVSPTRAQGPVDNRIFWPETRLPSNRVGSPMPKTNRSTPHTRAFRQRLRAAGGEEVLFQLPRETVALLDELKERQGLRNRSQALLQLIEQGRATAQQMT